MQHTMVSTSTHISEHTSQDTSAMSISSHSGIVKTISTSALIRNVEGDTDEMEREFSGEFTS